MEAEGDPGLAGPGSPEDAQDDAQDDAPEEARLARCAARALALPPERCRRWDPGPALRGFVRGSAGPALLAWRGPGGELGLCPGPPPPPPGAAKALFFLRPPAAGPGPAELLCGDLPAEPLPHFAALVEEVRRGEMVLGSVEPDGAS